jgi:hypothetical protein
LGTKESLAEWENEGGAPVPASPRIGGEKSKGWKVMNTKTVTAAIGLTCLVVGLALGGIAGARYESRNSSVRIAAMSDDMGSRTQSYEAEISQLNARIDLTLIHLRLGRIALEADRQDYGSAGKQAASFFHDVALMVQAPNLGDGERAALENVLAARDELIAGLATAQPSAAQRLKELYLQIFDVASPS